MNENDAKEETDEDDGEEEGTDAVGWVTSMPNRRALVTAEHPPVLVLGAGEGMTVEIGYDLGIVHPPRLMLAGTYKSTNDMDSGNNGGKQQLELQRRFDLSVDVSQPLRPSPPLLKAPVTLPDPQPLDGDNSLGLMRTALRRRTLAQPAAGMATLRAVGSLQRSSELHLRGGSMLYADPQIARPWYTQSEARRNCCTLFASYAKAQFSLWEVCLFYAMAVMHLVTVIIRRTGSSASGSADSALSRNYIDQAVVSQGAVSLPMEPYSGSLSGVAVALTLVGVLALGSQVPEIITCYVITAAIHLAIVITSTGTTVDLFLPIVQFLMVYCAVWNRSRYNYSMIVADTSF